MDSLLLTIAIAMVSVSLRALCGVIDRYNVGLRGAPIVAVNALNSIIPFLVLGAWLISAGRLSELSASLMDPGLAALGIAVQLVGFAFSYGFKTHPVSTVNITARIGDILIPIALTCAGATVSLNDFLFAAAVSLCVFLAFPKSGDGRQGLIKVGIMVTTAVVLQSIVAEVAFHGRPAAASLEGAASLLFWRALFCLPFFACDARTNWTYLREQRLAAGSGRVWLLNLGRAAATLLHHVAFFHVLANGDRVIAWPILNAVPLFSAIFSAWFLREMAGRREYIALGAFVVIATVKTALG